MTHTYKITGMTCSSCEAKVKSQLLMLPNILSATVSKDSETAIIEMDKHIPIETLKEAIAKAGDKYSISETQEIKHDMETESTSWFKTYKPILLIFFYITAVTLLIQLSNDSFNGIQWMQHFMAGFFLVFSFFKLLDVKAFAESYAMYDIVAKKINAYGYIYPFLELALGVLYLINFNHTITNATTVIIMSISAIGVIKSVLNKQQIQCACLGAVFNLPMSTVTIIEDVLMVAMAAIMLLLNY